MVEKMDQFVPHSKEKEPEKSFEKKALAYLSKLKAEGADEAKICNGLAGLDSEEAWQARDGLWDSKYREEFNSPEYIQDKVEYLRSLTGLSSERATDRRREIMEINESNINNINSANVTFSILESLAGVDNEGAWEIRDKIFEISSYDFSPIMLSLFKGLAGIDSERAWKFRDKFFSESHNIIVLYSLAGLDNERAWKLRSEFDWESPKEELLYSLAGLDNERAWIIRKNANSKMAESSGKSDDIDPFMFYGLCGVDSEEAWELRDRAFRSKESINGVAYSLAGLDSTRAWQMRIDIENFVKNEVIPKTEPIKNDYVGITVSGLVSNTLMAGVWKAKADLKETA